MAEDIVFFLFLSAVFSEMSHSVLQSHITVTLCNEQISVHKYWSNFLLSED